MSERTEYTVLSVIVAGLLVVVVVSGLLGIHLSDSVASAATLAALVAILRVVGRVYDVDASTQEILVKARAGTNVQRFRTYPEFYKALSSTLAHAQHSVRVTHIRDDPPDAFRIDSGYYSDLEHWAETHPECPVRRVIAINNSRMYAWGKALRESEEAHVNFGVRVTSRSSGLPVINMAILDGTDVFLAISGETPEETAGVWINDGEVGRYFADYYDHLWSQSEPLRKALEGPVEAMGEE